MGLLTLVKKQRLKDHEKRVLLLGLDNAGKSTIVKRIVGEDVYDTEPTLGFTIRTAVIDGITLTLWDIGGQSSLRPYWQNYFSALSALIFVIDAAAGPQRLRDAKAVLNDVLQEERLFGITVLVLANKSDLQSAIPLEEITRVLALDSVKTHDCLMMSCSAITGTGVNEGIEWLVERLRHRL